MKIFSNFHKISECTSAWISNNEKKKTSVPHLLVNNGCSKQPKIF